MVYFPSGPAVRLGAGRTEAARIPSKERETERERGRESEDK